jgi:hypothetical protein
MLVIAQQPEPVRQMNAQPAKPPQGPLEAFETFVAMVRRSPFMLYAKPEEVIALLRPFLANPDRNEAHVREIVLGYMMSRFMKGNDFVTMPFWEFMSMLMRQRLTKELLRMEALEAALRTELKPGSVALHVKPVRYLETPAGFAEPLRRYRIEVQLFIEEPPEDAIESVRVEIRLMSDKGQVNIDDISPKPAFSQVERKEVAGAEIGLKQTISAKVTVGLEPASGPKFGAEAGGERERSVTINTGVEQGTSRMSQYLYARKLANRALWRVLAGVGAIDVAGEEYSVEFLAPASVGELELQVDANIEWLRAGIVPAELRQPITLPPAPAQKEADAARPG